MKYHQRIKIVILILFTLLLLFRILDLAFPFCVKEDFSLLITDNKGKPVHVFLNSQDKWRFACRYEELPEDVIKAIVYKEDKYFYYHFGINPFAIGRAFFQNLLSGKRKSGASTITMQVVRILEHRPRVLKSKFVEIFRALQLESQYSKQEILTLYLNHVPYGGNIEGVKAASMFYFDQMPVSLSLAQVALLASIPNDPNRLRPGVNDDFLIKKRNALIKKLGQDNIFQKKIIEDALQEPFMAQRHPLKEHAAHFSWNLKQSFPNAATLNTFIDLNIQEWLEKKIAQYSSTIRRKGAENIAVLIVRNSNRTVLAWQGSVDFEEEHFEGQVDGVRAVRSPGSTLKPLIYALAYDQGIITPKTKLLDLPVSYKGYAPQNYDGGFKGSVSAEDALALSLNIPAVELLDEVGVPVVIEKLTTCDFRSITKKQNMLGLSLALGGCGCSLFELTGLYCAFANGGVYKPLNLVNQLQQSVLGDTIISPEAAYIITENITKLRRPDFPNGLELSSSLPRIAWKTGTSYGRRDAWAIGYNPDYTIGVWIGNFSGKSIQALNGAEFAVPLLFDLFASIDSKTTGKWFVQPSGIACRLICTESGAIPNDFCSSLALDYYKPGISSEKKCEHLFNLFVNEKETLSFCEECHPAIGFKMKYYPNIPPELAAYYEDEQIPYEKIPPHNPKCTKVFSGKAPIIIAPETAEYFLENGQQLMLACVAESDVKNVFWFINHHYVGGCLRQETFFVKPPSGKVIITVADDKGRKTDMEITIKYL